MLAATETAHIPVIQAVAKGTETAAYTAAGVGIQVSEPPLVALPSSLLAAAAVTAGAALAVPEAGVLVRPVTTIQVGVAAGVVLNPLAVLRALAAAVAPPVLPTKAAAAVGVVVAAATSAAAAAVAAAAALEAVVDQASPPQP